MLIARKDKTCDLHGLKTKNKNRAGAYEQKLGFECCLVDIFHFQLRQVTRFLFSHSKRALRVVLLTKSQHYMTD